MRFQLRAIRKETDTPLRVESESNLRELYRAVTSLVFCILLLYYFSSNMRVHPRHTFSLTAYAKVIVINAFSVWDQKSRQ